MEPFGDERMGGEPDRERQARRRERLAESLRENLKRRKAQQRERATRTTSPPSGPEPEGTSDGSH
jgi:hypothetical protein